MNLRPLTHVGGNISDEKPNHAEPLLIQKTARFSLDNCERTPSVSFPQRASRWRGQALLDHYWRRLLMEYVAGLTNSSNGSLSREKRNDIVAGQHSRKFWQQARCRSGLETSSYTESPFHTFLDSASEGQKLILIEKQSGYTKSFKAITYFYIYCWSKIHMQLQVIFCRQCKGTQILYFPVP